jgi:hypothetical protein
MCANGMRLFTALDGRTIKQSMILDQFDIVNCMIDVLFYCSVQAREQHLRCRRAVSGGEIVIKNAAWRLELPPGLERAFKLNC